MLRHLWRYVQGPPRCLSVGPDRHGKTRRSLLGYLWVAARACPSHQRSIPQIPGAGMQESSMRPRSAHPGCRSRRTAAPTASSARASASRAWRTSRARPPLRRPRQSGSGRWRCCRRMSRVSLQMNGMAQPAVLLEPLQQQEQPLCSSSHQAILALPDTCMAPTVQLGQYSA